MSEMVERVARALCARHYALRFGKPVDDEHVQLNVRGEWHRFADEARAAIAAMREPTEAMHVAAFRELRCHIHDLDWAEDTFGKAYTAMIDEALK